MSVISITDVLAGKYPVNEAITINGWIRTRRDSKAGISFLAISTTVHVLTRFKLVVPD